MHKALFKMFKTKKKLTYKLLYISFCVIYYIDKALL